MNVAVRLLIFTLVLATTLFVGLKVSHVYARTHADENKYDNLPPEIHVTKHLRPASGDLSFYQRDPRVPVQKGEEGIAVQILKRDDKTRGGPILGTETKCY